MESKMGNPVVEKHAVVVAESHWPTELEDIIENLQYRPGWTFDLVYKDRGPGSKYLMFKVVILSHDTYGDITNFTPDYYQPHYFVVPSIEYSREAWIRWVLDRLLDIDRHEGCEFFKVNGKRLYAPMHVPDSNPYIVERRW